MGAAFRALGCISICAASEAQQGHEREIKEECVHARCQLFAAHRGVRAPDGRDKRVHALWALGLPATYTKERPA